jgi:Putative Ig domain
MRKCLQLIGSFTAVAVFLLPGSASAAVHSGSEVFNANDSAPTFNAPPQLPLITFTASYDDAGTITITESGVVPSTPDTFGDDTLPDVYMTGASSPHIYMTADFGEHLEDDQVDGDLYPQFTRSPDGSTETDVWSSPYLANLGLTFVSIAPNDFSPSFTGSFYFDGDDPTIALTNPGPQAARAAVRITPLQIAAKMVGVSEDDLDPGAPNSAGITGFVATGLPPGLSVNSDNGKIVGTPTTAGTYTSTVTAQGQYNSGAQTTSASTIITWSVAPPPPASCKTTERDILSWAPNEVTGWHNMTCPVLKRLLRHSRIVANGNLRVPGFKCRLQRRYHEGDTTLGAKVRCTAPLRSFQLVWGT